MYYDSYSNVTARIRRRSSNEKRGKGRSPEQRKKDSSEQKIHKPENSNVTSKIPHVCMYMYVCMHVCVCMHICVCTYVYARMCMYVCMYVCVCMYSIGYMYICYM